MTAQPVATHTPPAAVQADHIINCGADSDPNTQTEWLLTNGLGGFAMGTVAAVNTRRYHGLLVASKHPPVQRINTVAALGETLTFDDQQIELFNHPFHTEDGDPVVAPQGWRHLRRFELRTGHWCRWTFQLDGFELIKELRLVRHRNVAAVQYRIEPIADAIQPLPLPISIRVAPFIALRDFHTLRRAGAPMRCESTDRRIAVQADSEPPVHLLADGGAFNEQPDWWYGLRLDRETERGLDDTEDLFVPGSFQHVLSVTGASWTICFGTEQIDQDTAAGAFDQRADHLAPLVQHVQSQTPASSDPAGLESLVRASDAFVVQRGSDQSWSASIIAGYPWFGDWGRDTMIALPGLLLATGRDDEARSVLTTFAAAQHDGLIPNLFDERTDTPHYNTVDASLWFIHAALEYTAATRDRRTWTELLLPTCRQIINHYMRGTQFDIHMDGDGLISAGNPNTQLTWMDAQTDGVVFTPRHGKAVEINALWYRALIGLALVLSEREPAEAEHLNKLAARVKRGFNRTFWSDETGCLIDHVRGDDERDTALRPNQVFAVSLPVSPLPRTKQMRVMQTLRNDLLTPMGLRSLSPHDRNYHGRYQGAPFQRDKAYHQGTVWGWLIGPFTEGWLRAHRFSEKSKTEARTFIAPLIEHLQNTGLGQIHEIFEGDPPHEPRGTIAQAWSISELLRVAALLDRS